MPERFETSAYRPETTKLMKAALESAWDKVKQEGGDAALTRLLLASAIIDHVDIGVTDSDQLAAHAVAQLSAANRLTAERLD
jgi:hypothetical protein